jgi:ubiquinol-cytochrome c reductase cytochrome b subunit
MGMSPPPQPPSPPGGAQQGKVFEWFDRRVGLRSLLHEALDEPIPGGASWAYVFGSGLLFIFLSQIITGVFLAMYYVPSADHAHTTVAYITKSVAAGSFLRSLHVYGASAMVIILVLHLSQTYLYGAYKRRRELLWLSGCVLLALVLGMAFTGYLLPWDEKAYFATAVGTNIMSEIPFVGEALKELMRGGTQIGTLTLSRFFVAHVFFIPAMIFMFVAIHIFLFRRAGAAGPPNADSEAVKQKTEYFYPRQLLMDLGFTLMLISTLGALAYFFPASLGPQANPANTEYVPRPEWYYRSFFEWLKMWHGSADVIGILVIPAVLAILFVTVPFTDRKRERRPWRRGLAVGAFGIVFTGLVYLGGLSYYQDHQNKSIHLELANEAFETDQYMKQPFRPALVGGTPPAPAAPANPLIAQGKKVFDSHACSACHGEGGVGTPMAPQLTGIGGKFAPQQLQDLFQHPTAKMDAGGMPHFQFTPEEMKALIAYLDSLK